MVQATLEPKWIPKAACPLRTKIKAVEEHKETIKGRTYQFFRLSLDDGENLWAFDLKFKDKNFIIYNFGADTDSWIGKEIFIVISPEGFKTVGLS